MTPAVGLAVQFNTALCASGDEPESCTVKGEFGSLLTIDALPAALPPTVGVKTRGIETFALAARLNGTAKVPRLNGPEKLIALTAAVAVPVFDSLMLIVLLTPTATLPKFTEAGLADSDAVGVVDPVPVREITAGELAALLLMVALPVTAPAAAGVNTI